MAPIANAVSADGEYGDAKAVLEPEIYEFSQDMARRYGAHPPLQTLSLPEQRAVAEEVRRPWRTGGPEMFRTTERVLELDGQKLRIRVYQPTALEAPAPALFYLHGGGFTIFSIDTHDRVMREYAAVSGLIVVGVDYPLSPENKFPSQMLLTAALVRWFGDNGTAEFNVDPSRLAIGGDSAGGNISMATCLWLRDAGEGDRIKALLLNYSGFKLGCSPEAQRQYGGPGFMLNGDESHYFWGNYTRGPEDLVNPLVATLYARLEGLPPVFLTIAECDILAEQAIYMEGRFKAAGVPVRAELYKGATHSFLEAVKTSPVARRAIEDAALWVRDRLTKG
jgi:acetyl esterase